ncbi:MAG TPA: DUF1697 domain-containing protein [Acidimicrobiales bacterium]|nr:DUF1697 domain-containing protein [Acidimicrobiales bacterium]
MTTYVAMLRGINVSGRNTLSMDDLRAVIVDAGGTDVRTYIQSGNAVFRSRSSSSAVEKALESRLHGALGTRIPVLVRTRDELGGVMGANPFVLRGEDPKLLHVTFLDASPDPSVAAAARAKAADSDEHQVIGREVYLFCPNGYGRTTLTNTFFERRFDRQATTRNWRTVTTLVEMAGGPTDP